MGPFKVFTPNQFHAVLFQKLWHFVGGNAYELVMDALHGGLNLGGLNETFLTLAPKVDNLQLIIQF